jgi:hypothetical protein
VELAKSYSTFIAETTQKAIAEFTPHQKAVGALMPKITAANKGEKVVFTPEEQTTLKNAAAAAKKFENISGLFTPKNLAALATQINNAKGILSTANKYAKSNTEEMANQTPSVLPAVKSDENNNESTPLLPVEKYVYTITDTVPQPIMANGAVVGYSATRTITRTRVDSNSRVPAITYTNIRAELITVDNANNPQPPALLPNGTGSLPTTAKYAANFAPEFLTKLVPDNTPVNIPLSWNALACTSGLPTPAVDLAYEAMAEAQMQRILPPLELPFIQAFITAFNNSTTAEQAVWQTAFNTANARLRTIQNAIIANTNAGVSRRQLSGLIKFVYFDVLENGVWVQYIRAEHVATQLRTNTTETPIQTQGIQIKRYWEDSKGGRSQTANTGQPNAREAYLLNFLVAQCGNTSYYSLNGGDGSIYSIDEDNAKNPPVGSTKAGAWYVAAPATNTPPAGITVEIPDWCDFNFDAIQRAATQLCNDNQYSMATAEGFTQRADRAIVRQMEALDNLIKLSAANNNPAEMQATITAWQQRVAQNRTLLDTMRVFQVDPNCFLPLPLILNISLPIAFKSRLSEPADTFDSDITSIGNTILTNINNWAAPQFITVDVPNEPPIRIQREFNLQTVVILLQITMRTAGAPNDTTNEPDGANVATMIERRSNTVSEALINFISSQRFTNINGNFPYNVVSNVNSPLFNESLGGAGNRTDIRPMTAFTPESTFNFTTNPNLRRVLERILNPLQ